MARPIAYEPHPVSPARKAELRAAGFKIVDAVFKPADEPAAEAPAEAPTTEAKPAKGKAAPKQEA